MQQPYRVLSSRNPLNYLRLLIWICLAPTRLVAYREQAGWEAIQKMGIWLASTLIWLPALIPTLARGLCILPTSHCDWYWLLSVGLVAGWVFTGRAGALWDAKQIAIWAGVILGHLVGLFFMVDFGPGLALAGGLPLVAALMVASTVSWVVMANPERGSGERAEWLEFGNLERKEWVVVTSGAFGMAFGVAFAMVLVVGVTAMGSVFGGLLFMIAGVIVFAALCIAVRRKVIEALEEGLKTGQPTWQGRAALAALALSHAALVWICFLGGWR